MSYSKFYYIEKALKEIDSKLLSEKGNIHSYTASIGLVYLALLVSQNYTDYSISVSSCFEKLDLPENFKTYFASELKYFFEKELTSFRDVSEEEMKEYITEAEKYFSQEYIKTPWGVCTLANMILDLSETDDVLNMCCGDGSYMFNTLKNYDVNSLEGRNINLMRNAIIEMIAYIQGLKVIVNTENMFDYAQYIDLPKTYNKSFSMIPWGMSVDNFLQKYADSKMIRCPKSDSQPLFIHSILDHLSKDGRAVVCVSNAMLMITASGIQQYLVDNGYLEAVIQLAPNLLNLTSIPFSLFVLSHNNKSVRFINATNIYSSARRGKNELSMDNISSIFEMYTTDSKFSISVSVDEIKQNEYKLLSANYLFKPRLNYKGVNAYEKLETLCVSKITRGVQFKSDDLDTNNTSIPTDNYYLNVASIKENEIIPNLPNLWTIDDNVLELCLKENDIVMSVPISTTPKVAIAKGINNKKIVVASNLYIIRVDEKRINPKFLKILLESKTMMDLIYTFNQGIMLSVDFLKSLEIPILSLEEQDKVVVKYENINEQIKKLKEAISKLKEDKIQIVRNCLGEIE